jgi:hypothetical protein
MTPEYATEIVEQPDGPRAPMRSHRRLDTVIRVSDGVVWVVTGENETVLLPATRS